MQRSTPRSAAIYCRISHDPSGERLGVRRQEDDCRAEAARRRWQVAGVYVDDDRSAFTSKRPRPEYQRLLRDLQAGTVDGVMIWRLDRLHRQPRELEEFIVVCDKNSVALATVTSDVDLSTSQGRLLARAWGALAVHESEVRSERLRRASLERARQGRDAWAVRMYGYETDRLTVNRREAAVVREVARRFLKGESLFSLAIDLNRRRVRSTNGKVWTVPICETSCGVPGSLGSARTTVRRSAEAPGGRSFAQRIARGCGRSSAIASGRTAAPFHRTSSPASSCVERAERG